MTEKQSVSTDLLKQCERALWRTLPSVMHISRDLARKGLIDGGHLTPGQYHILRNINRGAKSVSDLAEREKVSPPAISRHVDDLVKLGLLERTRDPEDRRSIILALTEEGQSKWDKMVESNHRYFSERMKRLSVEELETIINGLELLYSVFSEQPLENDCHANGGKQRYE